ncbi:zinc ribbon domain-containing protein [Carnobacterium inhibens]|uniref:zinc ribbon domain-containing protein n=1 Tax=Carnobacterium inhibens TaxID=147709 RepID=UPI000550823B|nr:zinc ribbon domain-containing protein [Carnobacterium inhibens]
MICEKCSCVNEDSAKFCEKCGHLLGTEPSNKQKGEEVHVSGKTSNKVDLSKVTTKIKKFTKVQKIGIIVITVIILLLAGGFAFAKNYYSKENQVNRYIEIINTGDATKIAKAISTEDLNFELIEENLQPYADYVKEDKEYVHLLSTRMKNEYESEDPSYDIYLKKDGKDLLFFNHYEMMINPVYAELSTNMEEAVITLNGNEIGTADRSEYTQKVGPLSPGRYTFVSSIEQYGSPLVNEQEVFFSGEDGMNYVDLSLSGVNIDVTSNLTDGIVYLNDKQIGQLEEGEGSFGPLSWNENSYLSIKKEFTNETLESAQFELLDYDESYYIDLVLVDEYAAQEFMYTIYQLTENLSYYGDEYDDSYKEELAEWMVDGEQNEIYQTLYSNAIKSYDDETISSVLYNTEVKEVQQVDAYEYEVTYDLTVDTSYSYDSDKEDFEEVIPFKATVVMIESDEYEDDYDALLKTLEVQ